MPVRENRQGKREDDSKRERRRAQQHVFGKIVGEQIERSGDWLIHARRRR